MDPEPSMTASAARTRVSTACEACRATKVKCQPSEQPGVCRKCLESKRECISRTGPRTRRPRRPRHIGEATQPLPPSGPSKTFTIDFDMPTQQQEVDENFDTLRDTHAQFIESIFPSESDPEQMALGSPPTNAFPTPPPSSSSATHSIQSLHAKPQFNLSSAASLLNSFRGMLLHFPCIVLRSEETVPSLAATRPFVLLAILAAASGSRTLQGHSLYDEEFRKVLGLKFVAGGERSLELLQGILIYCAWYPFHLRPKNKQAYHYIRMASDLIQDLELDQGNEVGVSITAGLDVSTEMLDRFRTYLAYYYSVSAFGTALKHLRNFAAPFTSWTSTCCDILERHSQVEGDHILTSLVRLANAGRAAHDVFSTGNGQLSQQGALVLLGLEAQHQELVQDIPSYVTQSDPFQLAELSFKIHLHAGMLLKLSRSCPASQDISLISPRLRRSVPVLNSLYTYLLTLDASTFTSFTSVGWSNFVLAVILGVRLSFPLPEYPDWDASWARSALCFDAFLARMCDESEDLTPADKRVDVMSASRVVLRVIKEKYDRRIAMLNTPAQTATSGTQRCPMLDGSLDRYFPLWDADFNTNAGMPSLGDGGPGRQPVFHDLWATMTMGWANEDPNDEL